MTEQDVELREVAIGDGVLRVADTGSGPPVLFVHGFPLDHTMWREQFAALAPTHRLLAPDLRGFGGSCLTPGMATPDIVTMERFADDLAAVLDALSIPAVTLCGLSMGGYVAWQFWKRHRARLSRLVLCDTRAAADTPVAAQGRRELADKVVHQGAAVVAGAMLPRLLAESTRASQPALIEFLRGIIRATNPVGIAAAARGMAEREDFTPLLPQIDVPTLVLCGEHDVISPVAEMQQIATSLPRAEFVVIPNAGHMAPLENPADTNAALLRFLA